MNRHETASAAVSVGGVPAGNGSPDEAEEPPGTSRRHPKWRDVPADQWDDWRWQMQNAIRTTSQLAEFLPISSPGLCEPWRASKRSTSWRSRPITSRLIDLDDPADPIALQSLPSIARAVEHFRRRAGRSAGRGQGLARPRPDAPLSGPRTAGDHARLLDVLPVLHAQTRDDGPRRLGRPQPQRRADDPIPPRARRNPRRHRLGRRSALAPDGQAPLVRRAVGRDRSSGRDPHRHARARHAAAAAVRSRTDRAVARRGQDLDSDPFQPPTRNHARDRPGVRGPGRMPACRSATTRCCSRA